MIPTLDNIILYPPDMKSSESIKINTSVFSTIDNYHEAINTENKMIYNKNFTITLNKINQVKSFNIKLNNILKNNTFFMKNWESGSKLVVDVPSGQKRVDFVSDYGHFTSGYERLYTKGYGYYYNNNFIIIDDGINSEICELDDVSLGDVNNLYVTVKENLLYSYNTDVEVFSIDEFFLKDKNIKIDRSYNQRNKYKFSVKRVIRGIQ